MIGEFPSCSEGKIYTNLIWWMFKNKGSALNPRKHKAEGLQGGCGCQGHVGFVISTCSTTAASCLTQGSEGSSAMCFWWLWELSRAVRSQHHVSCWAWGLGRFAFVCFYHINAFVISTWWSGSCLYRAGDHILCDTIKVLNVSDYVSFYYTYMFLNRFLSFIVVTIVWLLPPVRMTCWKNLIYF